MNEEITLGDSVECTIIGLQGIATSRCLYLHGCDHIGIQPRADNKTGKVPALVWVDSPQVKVIKKVGLKEQIQTQKRHQTRLGWWPHYRGGPGPHPGDRNHPGINDDEGTHLRG